MITTAGGSDSRLGATIMCWMDVGRDQGGGRRFVGVVPLVRRRHALRARPARAADAGLRALPRAPRPRARRAPDRRHARAAATLGLRSNLATPLRESYDMAMAEERAPRLCNDLAADPVYAELGMQRRAGAGSYLGVPLELSDGARVGALAALSEQPGRFRADDEQLFTMLARVLAYELERESNERDLRRLNDSLRDHARGMGAIGRVVRVLAGGEDARRAVCRAACEMAGAPVAFLLEPSGREFVSTAMSGVDMAPVTIQPRPDTTGRAFTARESYFVADARSHPALAAAARRRHLRPLGAVRAGAARRPGLRRADRDLAAPDRVGARGRRRDAAAARRPGRGRDRARRPARAHGDADADRRADRRRDAARVRGRAAARARPRPPRRAPRRGRDARPRPPRRVQHAARRARGRPADQGDRLAVARRAARGRRARAAGGRDVRARAARTAGSARRSTCSTACARRRRASRPPPPASPRWDGEEPAELLQARCDEALDAAKQAGRNVTIAAD